MELSIRENVNISTGKALIGTGNLVKSVGNGIVKHKVSLRGKVFDGVSYNVLLSSTIIEYFSNNSKYYKDILLTIIYLVFGNLAL